VLHSLGIPYEIVTDGHRSFVVVPAADVEKAKYEIWQYEQENQKPNIATPRITAVLQNGVPGVVAYLFIIFFVALLAGESAFDRNWLSAGRVDGTLIRIGNIDQVVRRTRHLIRTRLCSTDIHSSVKQS